MSPHELAPELGPGAFDPQIEAILNVLVAHAMEGTGRDLSLARLAKRTGLRQSTLRRYLTLLEEAGIVRVTLGEDGGGSAGLRINALGLSGLGSAEQKEGMPARWSRPERRRLG